MKKIGKLFDTAVVSIAAPFLKQLGVHKNSALLEGEVWGMFVNRGELLFLSRYVLSCICMALFVGFLVFSAIYDLSFSVCKESYFQRSGAILVASALTVEFTRTSAKDHKPHAVISHLFELEPLLINFDQIFRRLGWVLAILGTIIWAYGDLLISGSCL